MSEEKRQPVWIESLMTKEEWKERVKNYGTSTVSDPPAYKPDYYKGGVWRKGMGSTPTLEEIDKRNKEIESLKQFNLTK